MKETRSAEVSEVLRSDPEVITAAITPLELSSALWRRRHAGVLTFADHEIAERRFAVVSERWMEVAQSSVTFETAMRLLTRRSLRSLDALQLASALVVTSAPAFLPFVTLDKKLAAAARAEGFPVLP